MGGMELYEQDAVDTNLNCRGQRDVYVAEGEACRKVGLQDCATGDLTYNGGTCCHARGFDGLKPTTRNALWSD